MAGCRVCGKPTRVTHMGMDVCRACAVFYERNKPVEHTLECVMGTSDCVDFRKGNFTCRKCRLDRFDYVLKSSQWNDAAIVPSCSSSHVLLLPDIPPLIKEPSLIDRVRRYYERVSIVRRCNELAVRGVVIDPKIASKEEYEIAHCTYQVMNQAVSIMISALFDFAAALFPEFMEMSLSDKWLLIRNFQMFFHSIELHMRSRRYFTIESGKCFGTYTTYMSADTTAEYFSDCRNKEHIAEGAKTLERCIRETCYRIRDHIEIVEPTDDEFMALMAIVFWSIESTDASDSLLDLSSRYRKQILSGMMAGYKERIGAMGGMARIGELYGILGIMKKAEMNIKTEYEVYRMLDLFDDETNMYTLQKPDTICEGPRIL